ncbi:MAG: hypothetical protein ABR525_05175 [Candidatus Limnocylindria bacterium]
MTVQKALRRAARANAGLTVRLLGPPQVEREGRPVRFDTRKALALLAYLAVTGRPHARDQLTARALNGYREGSPVEKWLPKWLPKTGAGLSATTNPRFPARIQ